ncbi:MAG: DUF262 domain-containing protein [Hyphomicrobiales bacterium]
MNSYDNLPDATLVTFPEIFGENRKFHIPDYQRPYNWENDQRADLLTDIDKLALLVKENANASHFCGTIICTMRDENQEDFYVVDGQQRLTTLTLLHSCLCRKIGKKTFLSTLGSVRFTPQSMDAETYTDLLNNGLRSDIKTIAQQNYDDAVKQIDKWILNNTSDAKDLLTLLEKHFKFILFILQDENEVAKVFETINNRGKPLTQMDLVKNHLIYVGAVNKWKSPNVNEIWRKIQQIAGDAEFTDADTDAVLRATVVAQFKPGRRNAGETDFTIVARELPAEENKYEEFQTFVKFLEANFQTYQNLRNASNTDPKNPILRALTLLNHHESITGVLPLIFARQFRRKDDHKDAPVLTAIEKTNFRLYGLPDRAARSDSYNVRLHTLAYDYFRTKQTDQQLIGDLTELVTNEQKDGLSTIVKSLTLDDDANYDFYTWPWRRYFLACFEESLLDRQSFDFGRLSTKYAKSDRTNDYLSIEHIWPQKADDHSVKTYRDSQQIRRLGNLMLLPHALNISSGKDTLDKKAHKLKNADITLLRQNEKLPSLINKAQDFVKTLQERNDKRFGATRNRFNKNTIAPNASIALIKTVCDLREEAMITFALRQWRLEGETEQGRGFAGMFSFNHSGETFESNKETASTKSNSNFVDITKDANETDHRKRLQARNEVIEGVIEPYYWT